MRTMDLNANLPEVADLLSSTRDLLVEQFEAVEHHKITPATTYGLSDTFVASTLDRPIDDTVWEDCDEAKASIFIPKPGSLPQDLAEFSIRHIRAPLTDRENSRIDSGEVYNVFAYAMDSVDTDVIEAQTIETEDVVILRRNHGITQPELRNRTSNKTERNIRIFEIDDFEDFIAKALAAIRID